MVNIEPRATWGARRPDGDGTTLTAPATRIKWHHTVTTVPGGANATVEQERAHMRHLEDIVHGRFRAGIGYNVLIFPSGRAYQGVSFNRRGTHTGGWNTPSRGIAFVGNFDTGMPTAAALDTARRIVEAGRGRWWVANVKGKGHYRVRATACPGRNLKPHLASLLLPAVAPAPSPVPAAPVENLRQGSRGERVRLLQAGLNRVFPSYKNARQVLNRGRLLAQDGVFGPITRSWVMEFQRRARDNQGRPLVVDGVVGPLTGGALARYGIGGLGW